MNNGGTPDEVSSQGFSWLRIAADITFTACLLVIAVQQQFALNLPSSVELGSLRVDAQDIVTIAMVALAVLGRFWKHVSGIRRVLVGVILFIAVVSTVRWVQVEGLQNGINHERPWIYAFTALIFGLAFARMRWHAWRFIVVGVAVLIAISQALSLFALGWIYGYADSTLVNGNFYGTRPLGADPALIMVLAVLICLTATSHHMWLQRIVAVLLGLSCIWSQDRSVWLSLVVALLVYLIILVRNRNARSGVMIAAGLLGMLAVVSIVPVVTGFSLLPVNSNAIKVVKEQPLAKATGGGTSTTKAVPTAPVYGDITIKSVLDDPSGTPMLSTGTLSFRLEMWRTRLTAQRSTSEWMLGQTFGPNSLNKPHSGVVLPEVTSHSEPVEDLVRGGIIGMACILVLFVLALTRRRSTPTDAWIFVWALVPFGVVYVWPVWTWVILGLCLSRTFQPSEAVASKLNPSMTSTA